MGSREGAKQPAEAQRRLRRGRECFYGPLSATFPDPYSPHAEGRLITVGHSSQQRLLVVVHLEQGETIRIISARLATAHERKRHES
jgi:uncharacterized DUF497 family protein